MSGLGDFVVKGPLKNYKNNIAKPITMGAKKEEPKKIKRKYGQQKGTVAKVVNSAGGMNSVSRMQFRSASFFFTFCSSFLLGSDLQG